MSNLRTKCAGGRRLLPAAQQCISSINLVGTAKIPGQNSYALMETSCVKSCQYVCGPANCGPLGVMLC